jgi:hypothetical protein
MIELRKDQGVQGDVFFEVVDHLPVGAVPVSAQGGRYVIADGEVTGHAHAIAEEYGTMYEKDGVLYLSVGTKPAPLVHEEHEHWQLPAERVIRFRRQRGPQLLEGIKRVAD